MPKDFKIWIELTIPGFLYLLVGFFLVLFSMNKKDFDFLPDQDMKDYLPYISIIIIVLSSIIGYTAYKVSERIVYCFRKKKYDAINEIKFMLNVPEHLQTRRNDLYIVLVFYRLLIPGTFLLGCVSGIWLLCSEKLQYLWPIIFISVIFVLLFIITYILHRKTYKDFSEGLNKEYTI